MRFLVRTIFTLNNHRMSKPPSPDGDVSTQGKRKSRKSATGTRTLVAIGTMAGFVLWAHLASGVRVFHSEVVSEPGWHRFRAEYRVDHFGGDGQTRTGSSTPTLISTRRLSGTPTLTSGAK